MRVDTRQKDDSQKWGKNPRLNLEEENFFRFILMGFIHALYHVFRGVFDGRYHTAILMRGLTIQASLNLSSGETTPLNDETINSRK